MILNTARHRASSWPQRRLQRTLSGALLGVLLVAAAPAPLFAQVNHNAPSKYGATFYHWRCWYQSLPDVNVYPPVLAWNIREQFWWNAIVQRARDANLGFFAVNAWGQVTSSECPRPAGEGSEADPFFLSELITAIDAAGGTLKLALFDDTTSEVLQKNLAKGRGWKLPGDECPGIECYFDLDDPNGLGEGGWFHFYDRQWKRFFQAVPDQYRFKIDGRPVVFMWGAKDLYINHHAFSNLVATLKATTEAEFDFVPYVIIEEEWARDDVDPDVNAIVESKYDWFDPFNGTYPYATLTGIGDVQVGHAIPGFDGSRFNPQRPVIDRANGQLYWDGLNDAAFGDIVLIESINNVEENAHLIDTTTWGDRELTTTLWYTTNRP